jgi:hypothetical protein
MKRGKQLPLSLEALLQKSATEVKYAWAKVMRAVRSLGSVAITQQERVEMVVMDPETNREIAFLAFDQRLRSLDQADAPEQFAAVRAAKGRLKHPPKAGSTF